MLPGQVPMARQAMTDTRTMRQQLRAYWRPYVVVHLLFSILGATLLTPLTGLLLQGLLVLSGSPAVADQDIAWLLLSPLGMLGTILLASVALAVAGLELGALQCVSLCACWEQPCSPARAAGLALSRAPALLRLTLDLTLRVLAWILPFAALVGAVGFIFLTEYDINYYLSQHPPAFYYALAITLPTLAILTWLLGRRLLQWSLSLPLLLFREVPAARALGESRRLSDGKLRQLLRGFSGWLLLALSLSAISALYLDLSLGWITGREAASLQALVVLLGFATVSWLALNFFVVALNLAGFTLVVQRQFDSLVGIDPGDREILEQLADEKSGRFSVSPTTLVLAGLLIAVLAGAAGVMLLRKAEINDDVLVVAHRGAAGAAPENTIASIRQAIADGADWVEIDVQESRDGVVVVVHDSDFMKLAGDPVKIWDADLARIRGIDVGSWFDPAFSGERVPTLAEVLEEIRGKSKLVIELKYYGHDQALEQRVVDVVEAAGMANDVVVMSLKLPGIEKLKALRPEWTAGLLAATAVGDLSRLNVDFLAVNSGMANPRFIRRARATGKPVFVWTINDALSLSHWMSMGVDGVITDEPALAREVLAERAELSPAERLLLGAAVFFGKPDVAGNYRDNSP
jgi:glycerophosphoryl diester phosphodiesterase